MKFGFIREIYYLIGGAQWEFGQSKNTRQAYGTDGGFTFAGKRSRTSPPIASWEFPWIPLPRVLPSLLLRIRKSETFLRLPILRRANRSIVISSLLETPRT